jgi:hypothetical protein
MLKIDGYWIFVDFFHFPFVSCDTWRLHIIRVHGKTKWKSRWLSSENGMLVSVSFSEMPPNLLLCKGVSRYTKEIYGRLLGNKRKKESVNWGVS